MIDPAMWSRAKQVATYIVRDWMLLDATERTMDKLVEEIELELDKAFDDGMKAIAGLSQPLIRAAALEEAAVVAEDEDGEYWYAGEHRNMAMLQQCCREIAAAIRILKEQPLPSQEGGEP